MSVNRQPAPNRTHYLWLALALLLLTAYGSLIPLQYEALPLREALERFRKMPFEDMTQTYPRADWIVNALQYATLSFCWLAALSVDRRWYVRWLAAFLVIPAGCALAIALEFLQIYFPPRTVSANDILIEALGTVLGVAAWLLAGQPFTNWARRIWGGKGLAELAVQALPVYLIGLLVVHLMPFDVIFSAAELEEKFRAGRIQLAPFGIVQPVWRLLANMLAFLPLGVLLALAPGGIRRDWRWFLGVGLAVTLGVELLQLMMMSRYCDMTDVVTGTAAVLLGWQLVRKVQDAGTADSHGQHWVATTWNALRLRVFQAGPRPWLALAGAWAVVLIVVSWQPYHFSLNPTDFLESDPNLSDEKTAIFGLRRMSWAPLVDYYWGSRYQALDQFVKRSLSTAPLGICLALAFGKREKWGALAAVLGAAVLGVIVETGQYFIPERHPSVTDVLIGVAGAWLAFALTRHVVNALEPGPAVREEERSEYGASLSHPAATPPRLQRGRQSWAVFAASGVPREAPQEDLFRWLVKMPYWAAVALICVTAFVLGMGLVLLLSR
jgi:glycopeptide antibiotics resistance protein